MDKKLKPNLVEDICNEMFELDKKLVLDMGAGPDGAILWALCPNNCGSFRTIKNDVVQKCALCGDEDRDLIEEIQIP